MSHPQLAAGVRAIIAYKFLKGILALLLGLGVLGWVLSGKVPPFLEGVNELHQTAGGWGALLLKRFAAGLTPSRLKWLGAGLVADGVLTVFEGWALKLDRWWGPWVVVIATGSLLPFELVALVEHPRLARLGVLLVNSAIVLYLARRARLKR